MGSAGSGERNEERGKQRANEKCMDSKFLATVIFSCGRQAQEIMDILSAGKGHRAPPGTTLSSRINGQSKAGRKHKEKIEANLRSMRMNTGQKEYKDCIQEV